MADDTLLNAVRDYLRGAPGAQDAELESYIARGRAYLDKTAGAAMDYGAEDLPRQLLLDYCRYANSRATEMFAQNFTDELLRLRYQYGLPQWPREEPTNGN